MMKRNTIYGVLLVYLVLISGCHLRRQEHFEQKPLRVVVTPMETTQSVCRHTYVGEIEEQSSVALSLQTSGQVLRLAVVTGDKVRAGQVLLEVDSTQALSTREAAAAMLHQAEDGYKRALLVYREGGVSEQQLVDIETKLTQARSLYQTADRAVRDCRLIAPMSGTIARVQAHVGQNIIPGAPVVTLINTESLRVRFAVPETEIASIVLGAEAKVSTPAVAGSCHPAVVTEKSLIASRLAHTYDVLATIQYGDLTSVLLPGMMARVELERDRISGFVLPQSCVQMMPDGAKVWVASGTKAERRTITIGQYVTGGVLVSGGLLEGDKVITQGYQKLWQGAEITY